MARQKQQTIELEAECSCDPEKLEGMACCPINNTLELIGKKYTILILRNMMLGKQSRFNQFLSSIKGINPKILSARLREMEEEGLIKRTVFHETPLRVENRLTKKGLALKPILKQLAEFSMQFCAKDVFKDGRPRKIKQLNKHHPLGLVE